MKKMFFYRCALISSKSTLALGFALPGKV